VATRDLSTDAIEHAALDARLGRRDQVASAVCETTRWVKSSRRLVGTAVMVVAPSIPQASANLADGQPHAIARLVRRGPRRPRRE